MKELWKLAKTKGEPGPDLFAGDRTYRDQEMEYERLRFLCMRKKAQVAELERFYRLEDPR